MVGRVTSQRCAACRQRKVKCDLSRPSCSQCLKTNRVCPGYDTHSNFHTVVLASKGSSRRKTSPQSPLFTPVDALRSEFVFKYTHAGVAARLMVVPEGHLLQHLPRRLGHNSALDDAVRCICSRKREAQHQLLTRDEHAYLLAIRSLQSALNDADTSMTSETLAAATLLQMYEHFMDDLGWVIHANGVIRMLELRGPDKIENEVDKAILIAQVGNVFMNALRTNQACFLAEPEWSVLFQPGPASVYNTDKNTKDENVMTLDMLDIGVHIPGLLCQFEKVSAGTDPSATTSFLKDLHIIRRKLQHWVDCSMADLANAPSNQHMELMRRSSQITVPIFLALVDYMLVDILSPGSSHSVNPEDMQFVLSGEDLEDLSEQCTALLAPTQSRWLDLLAMDKTAAACSSTLLVMMLGRIVNRDTQTNGPDLRSAFAELHTFLREYAM